MCLTCNADQHPRGWPRRSRAPKPGARREAKPTEAPRRFHPWRRTRRGGIPQRRPQAAATTGIEKEWCKSWNGRSGMEGGEDGPQPICFGGHVGKAQSCQAQRHSVLLAAVHLGAVWLVPWNASHAVTLRHTTHTCGSSFAASQK
jgi:hypothetical protein